LGHVIVDAKDAFVGSPQSQDLALRPVGICGADFGTFLRKQYDEYGRMIRESNIKAE
jgi:hypothetical protein